MIKQYLLDTKLLLSSPLAIHSFDDNIVVISEDTIAELNEKSYMPTATGRHAQEALKLIAESLAAGGNLPNKGQLCILERKKYAYQNATGGDSTIRALKILTQVSPTTLVTNDNGHRVWALHENLSVEPFLRERVPQEQYLGRRKVHLSSDSIQALIRDRRLESVQLFPDESFTENEFLEIRCLDNPSISALAMYRNETVNLIPQSFRAYGIKPKNAGQRFALSALLAPVDEIPLVVLKGPAGTAKTFLALAAALQKTIEEKEYDSILVSRPNTKFDNDIGYLKGSEEEKIGPLIRPVMDNLKQLCRLSEPVKKGTMNTSNFVNDIFSQGLIEAQAMAYMRGRSISNNFILIDECQNMNQTQAFGITTRVGTNSKVVLVGDPEQIDTPELDTQNNGLSYVSEMMRGSSLCAQVTFSSHECVRSPLALETIKRMTQ